MTSCRFISLAALLLGTIAVLLCERGQALPPVKSDVCIAFFRQMGLTKSNNLMSDRAYVLNSVEAFRTNVLRVANAEAGSAEGFISASSGASGLSRKGAAGRLAGIEDFMRNRESDEPGKFRFTQVATLQGKENIRNFFAELRENIRIADENGERKSVKMAGATVGLTINTAAALIHNIHVLDVAVSGSSQAAALVAINLLLGTDSILRRPLYWDFRVLGQIEKSLREVESEGRGWALISRNFAISPTTVDVVRKTVDEEKFIGAADAAYAKDGAPLIAGTIMKAFKIGERDGLDYNQTWVGLDLLFEKNAVGEPELHIIMRGNEKRPEFPKKAPDKLKPLAPSRPIFVPQLEPVPIRN